MTALIETLITSQDYLNEEIVAEKISAGDFGVGVSPAFDLVRRNGGGVAWGFVDGIAATIMEMENA